MNKNEDAADDDESLPLALIFDEFFFGWRLYPFVAGFNNDDDDDEVEFDEELSLLLIFIDFGSRVCLADDFLDEDEEDDENELLVEELSKKKVK